MSNWLFEKVWQLIFIVLIPLFLQAEKTQGLEFVAGSWQQVKMIARDQGKPIFVQIYADWCTQCHNMNQTALADGEVVSFYNKGFVNYKINYDLPEGKEFIKRYRADKLPDLFYFSATGELLVRHTGEVSKFDLLEMGTEAMRSEEQNIITRGSIRLSKPDMPDNPYRKANRIPDLPSMQRQYKSGYRNVGFLYDYAYQLHKNKLPYTEVVNDYLKRQSKVELANPVNVGFIFHFSDEIESKATDILLKNKDLFKGKFESRQFNNKIKGAILNSIAKAAANRDGGLFKKAQRMIKKADLPDEAHFLFSIKSIYYQRTHNWKKYANVTRDYMQKYNINDPAMLNQKAWDLIRAQESKRNLMVAKQWVEKSIYIDPQHYNYETYAYILHKLGDWQGAQRAKGKAYELESRNTNKTRTPFSSDDPSKRQKQKNGSPAEAFIYWL